MEKKIEDYLHLYLGCAVYDSFVIDGKTVNNIIVLKTSNYQWVKDCIEGGRHRLILRPLSDMKEKEAVECALIVDCLPTGCIAGNKHKVVHLDHPNTGTAVKYNNYEFRITEKGAVYFYNTGNPNTAIYVNGTHEVFRYLLSKHFDLFGLIEAGLAIDKTKLKVVK